LAVPKANGDIIVLRHGETHWNREGRYQGHLDAPLTLNGIGQIRALAQGLRRRVAGLDRHQVWSSPLARARQSIAILCEELHLPFAAVAFDDRLMECAYGRWEGLTMNEIGARYPDDVVARRADKWGFAIPGGGESYADVAGRVRSWLDEQPPDRPALVLAHGGSGRILRCLYEGLDPTTAFSLDEAQTTAFLLSAGQATPLPADIKDLRRFGCPDAGLGVRI
jgi:probable phosphoglycerate mutase